jgi:hypothetical protein
MRVEQVILTLRDDMTRSASALTGDRRPVLPTLRPGVSGT